MVGISMRKMIGDCGITRLSGIVLDLRTIVSYNTPVRSMQYHLCSLLKSKGFHRGNYCWVMTWTVGLGVLRTRGRMELERALSPGDPLLLNSNVESNF